MRRFKRERGPHRSGTNHEASRKLVETIVHGNWDALPDTLVTANVGNTLRKVRDTIQSSQLMPDLVPELDMRIEEEFPARMSDITGKTMREIETDSVTVPIIVAPEIHVLPVRKIPWHEYEEMIKRGENPF